jgi:hypothetical protein
MDLREEEAALARLGLSMKGTMLIGKNTFNCPIRLDANACEIETPHGKILRLEGVTHVLIDRKTMTEAELLAKLSIQEDGPEEHLVMHGDVGQIAFEDAPGVMAVDFGTDQLIENCEFPEDVVKDLQQHREAIMRWIADRGFKVEDNTDPGADCQFGDGSEDDEDEDGD